MEDTYLGSHKKITRYGFNMIPVQDSTQTDRNRKSLGIPSMKHSSKIRKDYFKKRSRMILIISNNGDSTTTKVIKYLSAMGKKFIRVHEDEFLKLKPIRKEFT